jgi:hypothetical protein
VQDVAARTQAVYASEDAADGGAHSSDSGGGTAGNVAKPGEEKAAPASEQPQQPPEQSQNPEEPQPPASRTRSSYWLFQPIYTKVCSAVTRLRRHACVTLWHMLLRRPAHGVLTAADVPVLHGAGHALMCGSATCYGGRRNTWRRLHRGTCPHRTCALRPSAL